MLEESIGRQWRSMAGLCLCLAAFLPAELVAPPPPDVAGAVRSDAVRTDSLPTSEHFRLERLAEGVYAAVQNDRGFAVSNAGIVDLGDRTVIFDTFLTPAAARDLRDAADTVTGRTASFVVNSHFHNDHIRGNQVFDPGAEIISTTWTRAAIAEREPEAIAREREHAPERLAALEVQRETASPEERPELRMWIAYYRGMIASHAELRTKLPTLTIDSTLVLHGSERTAELRPTGNGHTPGDLVLYVPEEKVVFTGDVLFTNRHPWLGDGIPEAWSEVLRTVHGWDVETAVPGHGRVSQPEALLTMVDYLSDLSELVEARAAAGDSEEEIAEQPVPERYADWWYGRFYPSNLRFLNRQVMGKNQEENE